MVSGLRSYRVEPSSFEAGTDPERAQAPVSEGPPAPPCATFGHPDQVTLSIVYKRSKKSHPAVSAALLCPGILSIWKPDSMQKCDRRSNFLDNLSVTFFGTRFSHDNRSASIQNCESRDCHTPRSHEGVCMSVCVCVVCLPTTRGSPLACYRLPRLAAKLQDYRSSSMARPKSYSACLHGQSSVVG